MILLLGFFFILGSVIGSFINVVADRTVRGESIFGRSYCEYCKAKLSTLDLVPILSFMGLRARCRYCKHKLSWQYPIVETLTAVLFAWTFWNLTSIAAVSFFSIFYFLFVISILIVVAIVDFKFSLIPTTFVFAVSLLVLFYNYFHLGSEDFVSGVLSSLLLAFSFFGVVFATRGRGMGSGDIPLVFLLALFLGWPSNLAAVFLSFLSGAAVSIVLLLFRKKKLGQAIPFGPFLIFSTLLVFFFGDGIISWYLNLL